MVFPDGKVVLIVHGILSLRLLKARANFVEINEWVAPESNKV